jgi:hypothetical protein
MTVTASLYGHGRELEEEDDFAKAESPANSGPKTLGLLPSILASYNPLLKQSRGTVGRTRSSVHTISECIAMRLRRLNDPFAATVQAFADHPLYAR